MQKFKKINYKSILLAPFVFLSSCISLGPNPTPIAVDPKIDIQKFTECLAPLSTTLAPAFQEVIAHVRNQPIARARPFSEMMRPLLDMKAEPEENKWDVQSRLEELIARLATNMQILKPSGDLTGAASDNIKEELIKYIESGKRDVQKAVLRNEAYLLAYFNKSAYQNLIQLTFHVDAKAKLAAKLAKHFKRNPDDPSVTAAIGELAPELQNVIDSLNYTLVDGTGFIGREGTVYAFPGVIGTKSVGVAIDHNQIGADLIRILFESIRDTYAPLPVLANSTAAWLVHQCDSGGKYCEFKHEKLAEIAFRDKDEQEIEWNLGRWSHLPPYHGKITRVEFEEIEANARSSESATASVVGKAIRGGSWGALNNEAVAKVVETTAGVLARHVTERAGWCAKYSKSRMGIANSDASPSSLDAIPR